MTEARKTTVKKAKPQGRALGGLKVTLRSYAVEALIEQHPDDFHAWMELFYSEAGLTYERPMSELEKAQATVTALVEKYPSLAGLVAPVLPFGDSTEEAFTSESEAPANFDEFDRMLAGATLHTETKNGLEEIKGIRGGLPADVIDLTGGEDEV